MDIITDRKKKIIVVGDVCADIITAPLSQKESRGETKIEMFKVPGGAFLIRDIIKALPQKTENIEILSYPEVNLDNLSGQDMIHSLAESGPFQDKDAGETYYIKRFMGYLGKNLENGVPGFARDFRIESIVQSSPAPGENGLIYWFDSAWKGSCIIFTASINRER